MYTHTDDVLMSILQDRPDLAELAQPGADLDRFRSEFDF
jgi:hypothetical protein